jgi:hypothetical protein
MNGLRAIKSSPMSFVQLRTRPERPNSAGRQRISERGHAEHKADAAASEDQAQSRVGVDPTLLPAFRPAPQVHSGYAYRPSRGSRGRERLGNLQHFSGDLSTGSPKKMRQNNGL